MSEHSEEPPVSIDYPAHFTPANAGVVLEALGQYARIAADEGRGEDARQAFEAAESLSRTFEEAMWNEAEAKEGR
jgi:glycogen debranching enzyme